MSHCTILITKRSETSVIKDAINLLNIHRLPIGPINDTKSYKIENFRSSEFIYKSFENYDILRLESFHSSFVNYSTKFDIEKDKKIEKYRKRGWSEPKIQDWIDAQIKKNDSRLFGKNNSIHLQKLIFELARDYDIAFAYYWQEKEWNGFKGSKVITELQESYEENVIYTIKYEK